MASSILHITNGDYTTQLLKKLKINGSKITWREMLCEGKTEIDVGSEHFWKTRFDFFKTTYKITKRAFIDHNLKEYRNLCNQKKQDEIVLWFEYDLFCQINMLAVISWLKKYRKGREISLICAGKVKGKKKLKTINQLSEREVLSSFENRIILSQDDIEYADYIWQLYCSDSPLRLETVHQFNPMSPFAYLEKAIQAHLLRFPSIETGLNAVEKQILHIAKTNSFADQKELVKAVIDNQEVYGFSDAQYQKKVQNLKKLFTSLAPVKLGRIGKKVLDGQLNYYGKIRSEFSYLGGSKKYSYLYVNDTGKLLKITS